MTKKILLTACFFLLLLGGCAKKQVVKPPKATTTPPPQEEMQQPGLPPSATTTPSATEEPAVRFQDWERTPELQNVYFDYDSADLSQESRDILKKNADYLIAHPELNVLVEGNCDERGTTEYNLALGQRRASVVREYYGQLGVLLGRIATISYGKENPIDPRRTEAAWAKNRRTETRIRKAR